MKTVTKMRVPFPPSVRRTGIRERLINLAPLTSHGANKPLVSVVIPCYNYGQYLKACVGSVLSQNGVDLQIVIVDDASTDHSLSIAQAIAAADPRVRVIAHAVNLGHIATYNDGLSAAHGTYVALLSADDLLAPGSLHRATALMEAEPTIGFTYGRVCTFVRGNPEAPVPGRPTRYRAMSGDDWLARRSRRITNCIMSPEVLMRRDVYEQIGPYSAELPHTGDLAMWMQAAALADVGYVDGPVAAFYRIHSTNMHTSTFHSGAVAGMLVDLRQRRKTMELVFDGPAGDVAAGQSLRTDSMRRLSAEALAAATRAYAWGLTEEWPMDGLVDFARETYAGYRTLPQWRALQRRQRIGPRLCRKNPIFVGSEMLSRARRSWANHIEERNGA